MLHLDSDIFTIKMNKKGTLASGMSETIYIQFKPMSYKYYYETLKLNTETENLLIPIHAYPVLDMQKLR